MDTLSQPIIQPSGKLPMMSSYIFQCNHLSQHVLTNSANASNSVILYECLCWSLCLSPYYLLHKFT